VKGRQVRARHALSAAVLAILPAVGGASFAAGPLDNPLTPELVDPAATADWVDGRETSRADFLDAYNKQHVAVQPTWFLAMPGARLGHNGISFGSSANPGPRHLRVGFAAPSPPARSSRAATSTA
jgi:hypothetical protein